MKWKKNATKYIEITSFVTKEIPDHTCSEKWGGCPRGVMVKAMDCGIVVRKFVLLRLLSGKYP